MKLRQANHYVPTHPVLLASAPLIVVISAEHRVSATTHPTADFNFQRSVIAIPRKGSSDPASKFSTFPPCDCDVHLTRPASVMPFSEVYCWLLLVVVGPCFLVKPLYCKGWFGFNVMECLGNRLGEFLKKIVVYSCMLRTARLP